MITEANRLRSSDDERRHAKRETLAGDESSSPDMLSPTKGDRTGIPQGEGSAVIAARSSKSAEAPTAGTDHLALLRRSGISRPFRQRGAFAPFSPSLFRNWEAEETPRKQRHGKLETAFSFRVYWSTSTPEETCNGWSSTCLAKRHFDVSTNQFDLFARPSSSTTSRVPALPAPPAARRRTALLHGRRHRGSGDLAVVELLVVGEVAGFDEAASVGQAQLGQHMSGPPQSVKRWGEGPKEGLLRWEPGEDRHRTSRSWGRFRGGDLAEAQDFRSQVGAKASQSQLKNLLDAAADTPRPLGSPLGNSGTAAFSPQVRGSSSPKAQAALVRSCELRAPGPEYQGPKLEPEATVTLDFVMSLVRHFQHQRNVPLPARYLCRLLEDAEKILEIRDKDGPVHQLSLASKPSRRPHETENLVIVGDLHGQLADLLWIFFKVGVPSPNNRFLVNGDICDRGENATEIWALLFAFMSLWPESIYVHRGNHEDRLLNMDYHCGGFYDEVLRKYGRQGTGQMIYEKFGRIFARLPLASVIDNQIFVVHGGLSRGAPGSFLRLLRANRTRNPEIPSASMGASAVDLAFIDAMWADPQEYPGSSQNPRGPGLSAFGPDVTERFLAETGYALVVRSHQVPPNNDGFYVHHKGKLFTVFSASNYCGLTGNQGAVLVVKKDSQIEAVRHMAPPFEALQEVTIEAPEVADETPAAVRRTRQLQRQSTAGQVELREAQASLKDEERAQKMYQEAGCAASS
ncbi:Serine/threonine-protein phosphatase 5 [Durusdinium trenchii]|uniref:protein-serine/threonine phosphatase n=1 Tax=Durusdinium trenchii TaxID=1381693 RepID=A0ABP0SK08_9DINO